MEKNQPLWSPSEAFISDSNLHQYQQWLSKNKGLSFPDYQSLWQWSVDNTSDFWQSIVDYFDVQYDGAYSSILSGNEMPFYTWFDGIKLNYAEHIFRRSTPLHPAIIYASEASALSEMSWNELTQQVASLQQCLKQFGVRKGDRVVAYMPCSPEATIAFLATNALGAIWSSCSPDFGTQSVIDRFAQVEPKVLIAVTQYTYGGKTFDKTEVIKALEHAIPSLEKIILISSTSNEPNTNSKIIAWDNVIKHNHAVLHFERVPFQHPIWILYSSGTTGLPKAITHSHGGILLEQLKYGAFHNDFKPGEKCFWYTTTGWMMWNYIHGSLLAGGIMVLYDGSPAYPTLDVLWQFIQDAELAHFGTSAGFILACMKEGAMPSKQYNLSSLRSIGSTGSTLPPEGFDWVYKNVKHDLWLTSMSGGTDICSAFVGGNPTLPVYAGEIQCRALGCKLEAYNDDGKPVWNEVGEMVITEPLPSMPIYFWNDVNHKRYKESYFELFKGVWRHGDWIKITEHNGVIIYGRSDATLNRGGIRIGTSEIYRAMDNIDEVKDSLIVCIEKKDGQFWMPLFVVMKSGVSLTVDLKKKISTTIRSNYSPRHVPDEIIEAPDLPYTISGKKTETPVKKVLMGKSAEDVVNAGSLRNPESIAFFVDFLKS